jgi:hypothetical protein
MRKKSILLGVAAAGAIVLSTVTVALPASAAPVPSSKVSSSAITSRVSPDSAGKLLCSGNLCVQRTTNIENNEAYVEAWAFKYNFTGWFTLYGPDGAMASSPGGAKNWVGGGGGWLPLIPKGSGYYIIAWQKTSGAPANIGEERFSV